MSIEFITGTIAVVAMLGTIFTKYITTVRILRLRETLLEEEAGVRNLRGQLKVVQNEKGVADRQEKTLAEQKERLEKRLPRLQEELKKLKS
jgi:hypothetical protein